MAIRRRTKIYAVREFTDRLDAREAFWTRLDKMLREDGSTLLTYYGAGGIGKTSLLRKILSEFEARREEFPDVVVLNYDFVLGTDYRAILNQWKLELKEHGCEFPFFETADFLLSIKQGISPRLLDSPEIKSKLEKISWFAYFQRKFDAKFNANPKPLSTEKRKTLLGTIGMIPEIDVMPGGKAIAGIMSAINHNLSQRELDRRLNEHVELRDELTRRVESCNLNELEELFPTLFAQDVFDWAEANAKQLIILLDTYELLGGALDNNLSANNRERDWWIKEDAGDALGLLFQMPPTLWVIFGRNDLHWSGDAADELEHHLLTPLSEDDSHHFLTKCGVLSRELRDRIYQLTEGYPMYLDLCVDTYERFIQQYDRVPTREDFGQSIDRIIERLMKYMDASARLMVQCLSLLGTWTDEIARKTVAGFNHNVYANVKRLSFIQSQSTRLGGVELTSFHFDRTLQKFMLASIKGDPDFNALLEDMLESVDRYFSEQLASIDELTRLAFYLKLWAEITVRLVDDDDELMVRYRELFEPTVEELINRGQFSAATSIVEAFLNSPSAAKNARLHGFFDGIMSEIESKQGHLDFALAYARAAYENYSTALGEEHSDTLDALCRLIRVLLDLQRFDEALSFKSKLLGFLDRLQGLELDDTLASLLALANPMAELGFFDEAFEIYARLLEVFREMLGDHDSIVLGLMSRIANTLGDRCLLEETRALSGADESEREAVKARFVPEWEHVLRIQREVLELRQRFLGRRHVDTLASLDDIAETLLMLSRVDEALTFRERAFERRREILGEDHAATLESMKKLAEALSNVGRLDEAVDLARRCLELNETVFGIGSPQSIGAMDVVATVLEAMEQYEDALALRRRQLEMQEAIYGSDHIDVMMTVVKMSGLLSLLGRDDEASAILERCSDWN